MSLPYKWRILAQLPGHAPIELFRTDHPYDARTWAFNTRDLSPDWTRWAEYTLADKGTITPRIRITHKTGPERLYLTAEEKQIAGVRANL